jgi:lipoyl(octanoyl) transferase
MARTLVAADPSLQVYLLGTVDFEAMLQFQRRLVYEVSGDRTRAALVLCDHAPLISVGREGSREHIGFEPHELDARELSVRWVNRGGGCLLHAPGQLAVYPILPLDRLGLKLKEYLDRLHDTLSDVVAGLSLAAGQRDDHAGIWVHGRMVAHVGVAVRQSVSYFGAAINVHPDMEPFRRVLIAGPGEPPMTSLARESRDRVRDGTVRQRVVESFARQFGFQRVSLFHSHPALTGPAAANALASAAR